MSGAGKGEPPNIRIGYAHYPTTFQLAGVGLARVAADGQFLDVNEHLCKLLGYPREQLLAMRFHDLTHQDDLGKNTEQLALLKSRQVDGYRMQKRYVRGNGEILWADLSVAPERNENGEIVSLISIVSDIRAFKQSEERMDFLLSELAHRSKNLFTVVLGLINQTQADTVVDFRETLTRRIYSMAASQQLMLADRDNVTSFRLLVQQQLSAFVAVTDQRLLLTGEDIDLGLNATRILGMALHELATNSCKYGALSTREGMLTISCVEQSPDHNVISWKERGGPLVSPPGKSGFGRNVIERMVARSLHADVALQFDPDGVEWRCTAQREELRR
jgi:PAS domain S-box-containing protein